MGRPRSVTDRSYRAAQRPGLGRGVRRPRVGPLPTVGGASGPAPTPGGAFAAPLVDAGGRARVAGGAPAAGRGTAAARGTAGGRPSEPPTPSMIVLPDDPPSCWRTRSWNRPWFSSSIRPALARDRSAA